MTALLDAPPVYALEIRNASVGAPRRVRHWLSWVLEIGQVAQVVIDSAVLAASELVTNAVVHTDSARVIVSAQLLEAGVRLVVHDDAPATDWHEPEGGLTEHGRGLILVRALAIELDITTGAGGTTVTALIPVESS